MKQHEKIVNFYARNSVTAFQKKRYLRKLSRLCYQAISNFYCAVSPEYIRHQRMQDGGALIDTYPWPYREAWFADWEEDSNPDTYSLVGDTAGFVIKHSTSYCAWKIFEFNNSWLKRTARLHSHDAKHWHCLLFYNGYSNTVKRPEPGKKYIGIAASKGVHGEVVWFEGFDDGYSVDHTNDTGGRIIYSTYRDKEYTIGAALDEWYVWVEITKSHTVL